VISFQSQIGRTSPRTDGTAAGAASLTVNDNQRILDADNTASPLYGLLTPGGTTTVRVLVSDGASWVPLFTGLIEQIDTGYTAGLYSQATINLVDSQRDLNLHIPAANVVYPTQQTGARISALLGAPDRAAWGWINRNPHNAFAIDAGQKVVSSITTDGTTSSWTYAAQTAADEKGLLFFSPDGIPTYHDQKHRYRVSSPLWVFGDNPATELMYDPSLTFSLPNDRTLADVAYATGDGITSGWGPNGAFSWKTNSATASVSGNQTDLVDQFSGGARARWEFEHYSVNRRDAPTVQINALGDWPTLGATSRFAAALNVKISDYVQLNRRPPVGSQITKFYWVDAIAHDMAYDHWTTTFTLVTADEIVSGWRLGVDYLDVPSSSTLGVYPSTTVYPSTSSYPSAGPVSGRIRLNW
jgi:hypothetical protein